MEALGRRRALLRNLLLLEPPEGKTLLDLGAGHGKISKMARSYGYGVTAVDARSVRFPKRRGDITWTVADVSKYEIKFFDVILMLGLLYHLPLDRQLNLLTRCALNCKQLIIDTHVCLEDNPDKILTPEGYEGWVYHEADTIAGLKNRPPAAFNNTDSFWPTPDALERMCLDFGFSSVVRHEPRHAKDRIFFLVTP